MKRFLAFIRKEFYHVFRDRKTLLLLFGVPIAQIILFGFALTNEIKNSRVVVFDRSHDYASRQLVDRIDASAYFEVEHVDDNPSHIDEAFRGGKIKLAVVIPPRFGDAVRHLNHAHVQIVADASDPNMATTLTQYASAIVMDFQRSMSQTTKEPPGIRVEARMIYNPELKGITNFVPGVMALVLLLVCVLMTSISIVREKEMGTMEVLLVSPFSPVLVVLSKAVPYFFLSLINLTIILALSIGVMDMPMKGSIALLYAESALLIITSLSLGLLISNSTQSQQAAMLISLMGMMLPTMMFTGFLFPLENMPWVLQAIANLLPSKWYYIIVKSIMIKGLGFAAIWKESLILAGMTLFLLTVSTLKFKTRLA